MSSDSTAFTLGAARAEMAVNGEVRMTTGEAAATSPKLARDLHGASRAEEQ